MKKLSLALVIIINLCLAGVTANAQSKFSLGPNAGFGHSWVSNYNDAKFKLATHAGLSLVYSATEHFGVGLDGKYSYEGVKRPGSNNSLDLNYFRFPLKAIYFFNNYGDNLRPKIYVGPSFGFLSSAKLGTANVKKSFNSFDVGVTAGVGLNYRLSKNTWFNADFNYLHGLSHVAKSSVEKTKNRNLGLNAGVNFGL